MGHFRSPRLLLSGVALVLPKNCYCLIAAPLSAQLSRLQVLLITLWLTIWIGTLVVGLLYFEVPRGENYNTFTGNLLSKTMLFIFIGGLLYIGNYPRYKSSFPT
ncbi:MAG: hypothetical protein ACR2IE_00545 [Candidatus Sumerlaeaceae bacterium]